MIIESVGVDPATGREIDLVVRNASAYVPWDASRNRVAGGVGVINVAAPRTPASSHNFTFVSLVFSMMETISGKPAVLDRFRMSFLDIDEQLSSECISFPLYASVQLPPSSQLVQRADPLDNNFTAYCSSQYGDGHDNPTSAGHLTEFQRARGVVLTLTNTSAFTVHFFVSNCGLNGRAFAFTGESNLLEECPSPPLAPPSPPPLPQAPMLPSIRLPSPPPPRPFPHLPQMASPPSLPMPMECALFVPLRDLRQNDPPEWCNAANERRLSKALCESHYVTRSDGSVALCQHNQLEGTCVMSAGSYLCALETKPASEPSPLLSPPQFPVAVVNIPSPALETSSLPCLPAPTRTPSQTQPSCSASRARASSSCCT